MTLRLILQLGFAAILLFNSASYAQTNVVTRLLGSVAGRQYESIVLERDLIHQPKWRSDADSPPLAPRVAMNKAQDYAVGHYNSVLGEEVLWRTMKIVLLPVGGEDWIYVMEMIPDKNYGGMVVPMRLIVLQDGKIVEPRQVEGVHAPPFTPFR